MSLDILDTDHLSLQQRGYQPLWKRFNQIPSDQLTITIITAEEQLRGRLAQIRSPRSDAELLQSYRRLRETISRLSRFQILDFDERAKQFFNSLRQQKLRIGTQDLRIAAIALAADGILVTRNQHDFGQIPGLHFEDWTEAIRHPLS